MTGAREYAEALFLVCKEEGLIKEALYDLHSVCTAIKENPDYLKLLATPALSKDERVGLIDGACGTVCEAVKNLFKILAENRCAHLSGKIYTEYRALVDEEYGILRAEAVTAVALTDSQKEKIRSKLALITSASEVVLTNTLDPSILGGIKLRYRGTQIDSSIKERLSGFEAALKSIVI